MGHVHETFTGEAVKMILRIMPSGDEVDINLPLSTTGREVLDALMDESSLGVRRRGDDGSLISYKLSCKETGRDIKHTDTLVGAGIKEGFTLLLMPDLVAGGISFTHLNLEL